MATRRRIRSPAMGAAMTLEGIKACSCGAATTVVETDGAVLLSHNHNGELYELSTADIPVQSTLVEVWNRFQDDQYGEK